MSLKELLTRILNWIKSPWLYGQVGLDTYYRVKNTDNGTQVAFGIGSSGTRHGVWSTTMGKWLVHSDGTDAYIKEMKVADTVIEQGTSGIWTYRKWNSGVAECWGTSARSNVAMGQWGSSSLYYGTITADSWPSGLFTSAPNANMFARVSGGNGWLTQTTNMTASSTGTRYVIGVSSTALSAVNVIVYAYGRWK